MKGKIAEGDLENRHPKQRCQHSAPPLGNGAGVAASKDVLKAFGVEQFVNMGEPVFLPTTSCETASRKATPPTYTAGGGLSSP